MRYRSMGMLSLLLVAVLVAPLPAQKNQSRPNPVLASFFGASYVKAKLKPAQEQQLVRLVQAMAPEFTKIQKKYAEIFTKEQLEAIAKSRAMAIRAGTPPKNVPKRVQDTIDTFDLSKEQKEQLKEVRAEAAELWGKGRQAASSFLTGGQIDTLFPPVPGAKKRKK